MNKHCLNQIRYVYNTFIFRLIETGRLHLTCIYLWPMDT